MYKIYDKTTNKTYYAKTVNLALKISDNLTEQAISKYLANEQPITVEKIKNKNF